ncbi:MAG: hypothetical protein ACJ71H_04975 [Nitrososphaeraceae archaeon]
MNNLLDEIKTFHAELKQTLELYKGLEAQYMDEATEALQAVNLARWENTLDMAYGFRNKAIALQEELEKLTHIIEHFE